LRRNSGYVSMGRRHASCAQYSKIRPVRRSSETVSGEYAPTRAPSVIRWLRSTAVIESSCTAPSRRMAASTSALRPRRKRVVNPWCETT
jgi:hypothetical protein